MPDNLSSSKSKRQKFFASSKSKRQKFFASSKTAWHKVVVAALFAVVGLIVAIIAAYVNSPPFIFVGMFIAAVSVVLWIYNHLKEELRTLASELNKEHLTKRIFMPLNKLAEFGGIKDVIDFPHESLKDIGGILEPIWKTIFERAGKQQTIRKELEHTLKIQQVYERKLDPTNKDMNGNTYVVAIIKHIIKYSVELRKDQPFFLAAPPLLFVTNESLNGSKVLELERRGFAVFFSSLYKGWDITDKVIANELKKLTYWENPEIVISTNSHDENLDGWSNFFDERGQNKGTVPFEKLIIGNDDFDRCFNEVIDFFKIECTGESSIQDWYDEIIKWKNNGNILSIMFPKNVGKLNQKAQFDSQKVRVSYEVTYPLVIKSGSYTEYIYGLSLQNVSQLNSASMTLSNNSDLNTTGAEKNPVDCFEMLEPILHHPLEGWLLQPTSASQSIPNYSEVKSVGSACEGTIVPGNGLVFSWKPKKDTPLSE